HSWPEYGYVAADVFTCGETTNPRAAAKELQRHFGSTHCEVRELRRGRFPKSLSSPGKKRPALAAQEAVTV
ncbi:MAG: S-adenosylmethionine decarboxylase, partial [Planctomycetaceae bacterium]|nr:S-adenosylmethionine decarboxylase [Planctomycetaceae bacterium]